MTTAEFLFRSGQDDHLFGEVQVIPGYEQEAPTGSLQVELQL